MRKKARYLPVRSRTIAGPALRSAVGQARSPHAGPEPGHVRHRNRGGAFDAAVPARSRARAAAIVAVVGQIAAWLWFTVYFANFAEAMAEGRGKARADTLRATQSRDAGAQARRRSMTTTQETVSSRSLRPAISCWSRPATSCPADGEVVEGIASVDEVAITGESAPVIREAGGDRSAVTGGTRVVSDWIKVKVTAKPGESFLDRMIAMVEGAERQKTPNEIALNILLAGMTIIFLIVVATLEPFVIYSGAFVPVVFLVALLVTLIPTTIGGLLSAIGIAGMDRLVKANVIAKSGRAVEAAGDVDTLLLDKTGTITFGARMADAFEPLPGVSARNWRRPPCWPRWPTRRRKASRSSTSPASGSAAETARRRVKVARVNPVLGQHAHLGRRSQRRNASCARARSTRSWPGADVAPRASSAAMVERIAKSGGTPLLVARDKQAARRHPPQGHRQARHPRALCRTARAWACAPS